MRLNINRILYKIEKSEGVIDKEIEALNMENHFEKQKYSCLALNYIVLLNLKLL
ncbi:hypothetical protein BCH308197_3571 [Bacillus cereus H3081.97]|nr:hypothetical protein BCH308197_3571 [Bacillus cereus H3081.97]KLA04097.1 hypothetical protein B4086_3441 [Bacillus cereus]